MNNEAVQSQRFAVPAAPPLARSIAAAVRAGAGLLLAHVRETVTGSGATSDRDDLAGMNAHMLRDIGAECSLGSRLPPTREQYPRL